MTEFILSETKRLNALVTSLLECAKPRPSYFVEQDCSVVIIHAVELLQSKIDDKNVRLSLQLTNKVTGLQCDSDQILQVFLNLIMNALQHIFNGGQIVISSQFINETELEICVADNGLGIDDEDKSKIFEPFYTRREEGIGLGLTVVQQIIHAHHGKIFVTDSVLGGACFHVVLPVTQPDF